MICFLRSSSLGLFLIWWLITAAMPLLLAANSGDGLVVLDERPLRQFLHEQWSYEDELPFGRITDLHVGDDGFLWICSYKGFFRYDGTSFREYSKKDHPALVGGCVSLYEDDDGALWIGSNGNGLLRFKDGTFEVWTEADGLDKSVLRRLFHDGEGTVVFPGIKGLQTIKNGNVQSYPIQGLERYSIKELCFTSNGLLYLGIDDGSLIECSNYDSETPDFRTISIPEHSSGVEVSGLTDGRNGVLWIGLSNGKLVRRNADHSFDTFAPEGANPKSSGWHLRLDSDGNLWGGSSYGIVRIIGDDADWFNVDENYEQDGVVDITFASDGSVFCCAYASGLHLFRQPRLHFFSPKDGLPNESINAVAQGPDGKRWFGSNEGIYIEENGSFREWDFPSANGIVARDLFWDSQGAMWVTVLGTGVARVEKDSFTLFNHQNGLKTAIGARLSFEAADGSIWVGALGGLAKIVDEKVERIYTIDDGLKSNYVLSIFEDSKNRLWIGTVGGGICLLENEEIREIEVVGGDLSKVVFQCMEMDNGTVIAATTEGLIVIDSNNRATLRSISVDKGNEAVFGIIEDFYGNYWLPCNSSIRSVKRADFHDFIFGETDQFVFDQFDFSNALPSRLVRANARFYEDEQHRIWIPLNRGVAVVDPHNINKNEQAPKVIIRNLSWGEDLMLEYPTRSLEEISFKFAAKRIKIEYSGISFRNQENVMFKARLNGFDDWIETKSTDVTYTNLPPRAYTFELMARNADGVWTKEPVQLTFVVRPLFYQTVWFWLIVVILVASLLGLFYRVRVVKLREKSLVLEALVADRTKELIEKNEQIESNYENLTKVSRDLYATVAALKSVNDDKNHLMSLAAHDMRNSVAAIVGCSDLLDDMDFTHSRETPRETEADDLIEMVGKTGNSLLELIRQLLEREQTEKEGLENIKERRSLLELVKDVIEMNRPLANKKQQQLDFQCEEDVETCIDPLQIRMAIDNYISNSIKYSDPGSLIQIRLETQESESSESKFSSFAVFKVLDEGQGLTEEDKKNVFKRFAKLSAKPTGNEHSSGVGLSIVKEFVENHDGSVGVESRSQGGAVFYFKLPIYTSC